MVLRGEFVGIGDFAPLFYWFHARKLLWLLIGLFLIPQKGVDFCELDFDFRYQGQAMELTF